MAMEGGPLETFRQPRQAMAVVGVRLGADLVGYGLRYACLGQAAKWAMRLHEAEE